MIEPVLLTTSKVVTFSHGSALTNGSGFFFERDSRLFFITSRHVLCDETSNHHPDSIEIGLHVSADNLAEHVAFSIPLYSYGISNWRQAEDSAGSVDVAAIEIERSALPSNAVYYAFRPEHIAASVQKIAIGSPLVILGFPLGFHDTLHHVPVARQAIVASSFGYRFQGRGYFLTDARTHRGSSGSPVIMRSEQNTQEDLPWLLLGIHSARLDLTSRNSEADEGLGLNCAWYADILMTLTEVKRRPESQ